MPVEAVQDSAAVVPDTVAVKPAGTLGSDTELPVPESATELTVPVVVTLSVPG